MNTGGNDSWDGQSAAYNSTTRSGPKLSIKNATGTVNTGGTIHIANGKYTGENNTRIIIDKNMTIIGESQKGTIINGTGTYQIFIVNSEVNITIKNLTLTNGTGTNRFGGAIVNYGSITLSGCTFINNTALSGGAICNFGTINTLSGCYFPDNTATQGGAIYNSGIITSLSGCTFTGNNATQGGAIYNNGNSTINDCIFNNNSVYAISDAIGGAICNIGTLTVVNCTFNNNSASGGSNAMGGAIGNLCRVSSSGSSSVNCTVTNCTFTGNSAQSGGAILNLCQVINSGSGSVNCTVTNCKFTGNTATDWDGGAISNRCSARGGSGFTNCTVTGCIFTNNIAVVGGAISNAGTISMSGCTFKGNTVTNGDGGAIYNTGNLTAENCTFTGNTAANNYGGGAIYNGNTLSLSGCNFTNNNATNSDGGAICNSALSHDVTSTIMNCTFIGNIATYSGGAIASRSDGYSVNSTLTGCSFTGNVADRGGAIFNRGTLTANFNRFYNNTANDGSAISGSEYDSMDVENNWWGTNNPIWENLIDGFSHPGHWVILSVNATPNNINNTKSSTITADFNHINGGGDLVGGHIPDGPVTLNIPWGSLFNPALTLLSENLLILQDESGTANYPLFGDIEYTAITHSITLNTIDGVATATFYANEGAINPLFNPIKVTATADNYTTNNTESAYININKASDLYIKITSDKKNPKVGETFTLTYKLGNNGPDAASNVTITIPLPEGFEVSQITGDGKWTYNSITRTITWTLENVPVGDPYLYITGKVTKAGTYVFISSISSETYNINSEGVTPVTINTVSQVKAGSKIIPLQKTGLPLNYLILAILMIVGGLVPRRK